MLCTTAINTSNTTRTQTGADAATHAVLRNANMCGLSHVLIIYTVSVVVDVKTSLTARCHLAWRGLASSTVNFTDSSATRTVTTRPTCYELPASEMTYIVSSGALNSTQTKLRTTTHVVLRQRGWCGSISRDTIRPNPTTLQL